VATTLGIDIPDLGMLARHASRSLSLALYALDRTGAPA